MSVLSNLTSTQLSVWLRIWFYRRNIFHQVAISHSLVSERMSGSMGQSVLSVRVKFCNIFTLELLYVWPFTLNMKQVGVKVSNFSRK